LGIHSIKGFVIPTNSFVKIGITKIFCYNKMYVPSIITHYYKERGSPPRYLLISNILVHIKQEKRVTHAFYSDAVT